MTFQEIQDFSAYSPLFEYIYFNISLTDDGATVDSLPLHTLNFSTLQTRDSSNILNLANEQT